MDWSHCGSRDVAWKINLMLLYDGFHCVNKFFFRYRIFGAIEASTIDSINRQTKHREMAFVQNTKSIPSESRNSG